MPTIDGSFKTNDPWQLKSKNPSKRRDMVTEQNQASGSNRNPSGSKDSVTIGPNTNPSGSQHDSHAQRTEGKRQASPRGSSDMFGEKSPKVPQGRNASSPSEHPEAVVSEKRTSKKTIRGGRNGSGRNVGRNAG